MADILKLLILLSALSLRFEFFSQQLASFAYGQQLCTCCLGCGQLQNVMLCMLLIYLAPFECMIIWINWWAERDDWL